MIGFACILVTNSLLVATPWVIKFGVDSLAESITKEKLAFYALLIVVLTLVEGIFRFAMRRVLIGVSREIEYHLRNDLFAQLEKLPMSFYQRNRTGDLMSRATNDLSNVRMLLGPGIMYTANTAIISSLAFALMLTISWRLTLFALVPLPVVSLAVRRFGRRIHDLSEQSQARLADLSARVQESFAGIRVVKAFVQERHEKEQFRALNQALIGKNMELIRMTSAFFPALQFLLGAATVVTLWVGGREVMLGRISLGGFVAFTVYLSMLAWPVSALGWVVNLLERGRASMERLNYVFDTAPGVRDRPAARPLDIQGAIEFRNLTFSYNGKPVLRDINLKIPGGRTVAIVGATGCGKTSLVQLIPRLYDAPPRSLFIDGVPIEEISLGSLRHSIGFIPQDTFLFGETLRENIAFGVEHASQGEVERAAAISNIAPDIQSFAMKYETVVGERGITLSGGQKQRTAISRALIRNPRILILDDSLSSVDTHTEEIILQELRQVMRGRTSILISHRVSTVKEADEIVVLDGGVIAERGTHDELVSRGGLYAELHDKQLLEEELSASE